MLATMQLPTALLSGPARYLHWGIIQISVANLLVIIAMIVVFTLALLVPFPGTSTRREEHRHGRP